MSSSWLSPSIFASTSQRSKSPRRERLSGRPLVAVGGPLCYNRNSPLRRLRARFPFLSLTRHLPPTGGSLSSEGEPLAGRGTLPLCWSLSLWERWHAAGVTERARMLAGKYKRGGRITLTKGQLIAVQRLCRAGLALSGAHAPALPEGEPLAGRETLPLCWSLSLWERWHAAGVTERARMLAGKYKRGGRIALTKGQFIAVQRLGRAGLALSGAHAPALPKGEPSRRGEHHRKNRRHNYDRKRTSRP